MTHTGLFISKRSKLRKEATMRFFSALSEIKMSFLTTFHSERHFKKQKAASEAIIAKNNEAIGTVSAVKTCWWIKIKTSSIRSHSLDGAKFPHIIYFTYHAGGTAYQGTSCVAWYLRCPNRGETIPVFYDTEDPAKYAVGPYQAASL